MVNLLKKLFRCKIAMAAILTAFVSFVLFCIYTPFFGTNDDYIMSILVQNGDTHLIFMNYFLVSVDVMLQKLFTGVNMFFLMQIINCLLAFLIFNYVFMAKFRTKLGLGIAFVFDALFLYTGIINVQWTHTAVYMCASGFALLYYAFFCESRKGFRIFQIIVGFLFVITGACYRFIVFEVSVCIFLLMCACLLIETVMVKKYGEGSFKKALVYGLKRFLGIAICLVVVAVTAFGAQFLSEKCNASERYSEFKAYNSARAKINDYTVAPYKGNEEFYNSIDIRSQNDIRTVRRYYYDRDFFTTERFTAISQYSREQGFGKLGVKDLVDKWLDRFDQRLPFHVSHTVLLILIGGFGCIAAILLFIFRNKLKLLFPILLTLAWIVFLYRFTPDNFNYPSVALALLFVLSSYFYNRYHFLLAAAMSAAIFGLYEFQYLSRLSYRVTLTFFLPAAVFMLIAMSNDRLRVRYKNLSVGVKRFYTCVVALFCAAAIVFTGYYNYHSKPVSRDVAEPELALQDYINDRPSDVFVYNTKLYSTLDTSRRFALRVSDCPENAVVFADWQTSSYYYDNELKEHGIGRLFEEMIDDPHRHFVLYRPQCKDVARFYNDHYAKPGQKIKLIVETNKDVNKFYAVYKVVTVEKQPKDNQKTGDTK